MADFTSVLDGLVPSESIMALIWRGPNRELANGSPPFASHSMPPRLLEISEEMENWIERGSWKDLEANSK